MKNDIDRFLFVFFLSPSRSTAADVEASYLICSTCAEPECAVSRCDISCRELELEVGVVVVVGEAIPGVSFSWRKGSFRHFLI